MKKPSLFLAAVLAGTAGLFLSSCAYDPYYADSGYGYGGGGYYSTSVFISTGNPRWGYDPYCHSYYDYYRRAYYDPFLYGYYPVGFRPPIVYGVPHPHGWRPGSHYCPPPSHFRDRSLSNYRDREGAYRRENFSWSREVRQRDQGSKFEPSQMDRRRPDGNRDSRRSDSDRTREPNRTVERQYPGFDSSRTPSRPSQIQRQEYQRNDRPDTGRSRDFDRSRFENQTRENRQRSSPSPGFNNPVNLSPARTLQQRQAPSMDRGSSRQRSEPQRSVQRESRPDRGSSRSGNSDDGNGRGDFRGRR